MKQERSIGLSGNEIVINEALCNDQRKKEEKILTPPETEISKKTHDIDKYKTREKKQESLVKTRNDIKLRFKVPKGKIANIMGVMNLLQSKFETLEIELMANEGAISEQDYEDKIREAFRQLGIELDEE